MEKKLSNYLKPEHLLYSYKLSQTETAIFIATKQGKTNMAVTQIRIIISLTLKLFVGNIKNQIGTMIYFHRLSMLL